MREIVNSARIGAFVDILLPGFDEKGEPCRVHYFEAGEGEPLLLIPSAGQSLYTFRDVMPALAEKYRVIALDLPGSGESDRPQSLGYTPGEMAACLLKFLDALELDVVHAVGASFGAMYLIKAFTDAPDRFRTLTLLCPGGLQKTHPKPLRLMAAPLLGPLAREAYTKKSYFAELKTAYYDATLCTENVLEEYFRTADDYASRQALMYAVRNMDEEGVFSGVPSAFEDCFILWGGEDRWSPKANLLFARDALPCAWHYVIPNAGHFFWEEKGAFTADAIDRFIRYKPEDEEEKDAE